jgi:hypothetical protein
MEIEAMLDLDEIFERHSDEYIEFDRVENKRHPAPDIHVFLKLYEMCPPETPRDIVCGASNDEIYLDTDTEKFAEIATEADVIELIRCGVRYGDGGFCMFA